MKNIVICCDGTGNEYGKNNTNVVDFYTLVLKSDKQTAFYDPGIGTGGWEYNEELDTLKAKCDQVTGQGLQKNVEDAYRFLMKSYDQDDRVYLIGFSRGAFTARALGGMLYKCGLLRVDNDNLLEFASKIYNTAGNDETARGFKATFCRSCPAYFIGVWDTVDSLILNAGKRFYNARLNPEVKFGYQALAIDEKRVDFPPYLWDETQKSDGQTIEQVWFAGVHSDVGGWYDERGLSNIALQWMLAKASACGVEIDKVGAAAPRYQGNPHDMKHESYESFWIFRGSNIRAVPEGAHIHTSVNERIRNPANGYNPTNLPKNYKPVD